MRLLIVTGLSGAGKSQVLRNLEDIGYFCMDNLPPALIPKFMELWKRSPSQADRIAIGMDIRGGDFFNDIYDVLYRSQESGFSYEILFMEATDEVLVKRYKESRRTHPLAKGDGKVHEGIRREREMLQPLRDNANRIINTSELTLKNLKDLLVQWYSGVDHARDRFLLTVQSFGFKYGLPLDADMVLDVRFINNPFYIDTLRAHTGRDADVRDYILNFDHAREFLTRIDALIEYLIPFYIKEGKDSLLIAVGCTGGQHRSVVLADELCDAAKAHGHNAVVDHRDIQREVGRGRLV